MQEYDLLLAGNPASIELSREHMLGNAQADCENYWGDGDIVDPGAGLWRKQRTTKIPSHKKASAEKVLQSFNTWAFKREQPSDPQLMRQLILHAIRRSEPLSFALYWGKGPRCSLAEPDIQCLDFLTLLADRVGKAFEPGAALNLIFTDTHAQLNGHLQSGIRTYFSEVDVAARQRGFDTCWLGELTRVPEIAAAKNLHDEIVQQPTLSRLIASARKWYRGSGSPEQGALIYYRMNMVERRAVELAFPRSIFITFNGSELRSLFPEHLPIFYMYSLRRGIGVKPWFLPMEATPCTVSSCKCRHSMQSD
jgi:L-tyrosine isonitrile synthase